MISQSLRKSPLGAYGIKLRTSTGDSSSTPVPFALTQTSILIDEGDAKSFDEQIKILGFIPSVYSPHFSLVNKILVKQCHEKKIKLIPWTVNDLSKMKELKNEGVDGIITDDPRLFKQLTQ